MNISSIGTHEKHHEGKKVIVDVPIDKLQPHALLQTGMDQHSEERAYPFLEIFLFL
jgi:hypothetical protein